MQKDRVGLLSLSHGNNVQTLKLFPEYHDASIGKKNYLYDANAARIPHGFLGFI